MKVPAPVVFGLLIVVAAVAYYFYLWAAPSAPDPRLTMSTLGGMTPNQVVSLLGKPRGDSRDEIATQPTSSISASSQPATGDERRTFEYSDMELSRGHYYGHFYDIVFLNSHVTEVIVASP